MHLCISFSMLFALSNLSVAGQKAQLKTQQKVQQIAEQAEDLIDEELSLEGLYALPIVSIATGTAVPLEKAPSVASLITANDIKAMGAFTLDEVLEAVPGLHVIPSTLSRLSPVYSFRGMYTGGNPQVLFLINGQRIVSSTFSANFEHLGRMNLENISRIEVVRGPGSAIYGADAYSGVINIITKSAKELNGFQTGLRYGSQDTKNFWVQYGGALPRNWELALSLEHFQRHSDTSRTITQDTQSNFDALFGSSASLAPGHLEDRIEATNYAIHLNNYNWTIGLHGYLKRDSGVGAGAAQTLDPDGYDNYDQYQFSIQYQNQDWIKDWKFNSTLSYFYSKIQSSLNLFPSGAVLPVGNDGNIFTPHNGIGCNSSNIPGIGCVTSFSDGYIGHPDGIGKIPTFEITANYSGWLSHNLRFNIGAKQEKLEASERKNFGPGVLDSNTLGANGNPSNVNGNLTNVTGTPYIYIPDKKRTIKYLSVQDIWEMSTDWTLTAGIRFDHYSDFGSTVNPRLALVWTATEDLVTKLLYGEAFRAPSFSELYSINNPVIIGNNKLDPETIKTTELSFGYEVTPTLKTNISFYHYKSKDMIEFVANADGTSTAQNYKSLTGKGLELEATWQINRRWKIGANYTYQSTRDNTTHKQLEYVPKQQFYLDARWKFKPEWELSSQLNWVGGRERAEGDTRTNIDDYALVNLMLRRSQFGFDDGSKNWEFAVTIKNVLNKKAYEPSDGGIPGDYPLNERRLYAELRYHLK